MYISVCYIRNTYVFCVFFKDVSHSWQLGFDVDLYLTTRGRCRQLLCCLGVAFTFAHLTGWGDQPEGWIPGMSEIPMFHEVSGMFLWCSHGCFHDIPWWFNLFFTIFHGCFHDIPWPFQSIQQENSVPLWLGRPGHGSQQCGSALRGIAVGSCHWFGKIS